MIEMPSRYYNENAKPPMSIICRKCYGKPPFEGMPPCNQCDGSGWKPIKKINWYDMLATRTTTTER